MYEDADGDIEEDEGDMPVAHRRICLDFIRLGRSNSPGVVPILLHP